MTKVWWKAHANTYAATAVVPRKEDDYVLVVRFIAPNRWAVKAISLHRFKLVAEDEAPSMFEGMRMVETLLAEYLEGVADDS